MKKLLIGVLLILFSSQAYAGEFKIMTNPFVAPVLFLKFFAEDTVQNLNMATLSVEYVTDFNLGVGYEWSDYDVNSSLMGLIPINIGVEISRVYARYYFGEGDTKYYVGGNQITTVQKVDSSSTSGLTAEIGVYGKTDPLVYDVGFERILSGGELTTSLINRVVMRVGVYF